MHGDTATSLTCNSMYPTINPCFSVVKSIIKEFQVIKHRILNTEDQIFKWGQMWCFLLIGRKPVSKVVTKIKMRFPSICEDEIWEYLSSISRCISLLFFEIWWHLFNETVWILLYPSVAFFNIFFIFNKYSKMYLMYFWE